MAGRIKVALVVLALAGADGSRATDVPMLKGRVLGGEGTGGVWLGVVAEDAETATWTLVEREEFDVPVPLQEQVTLVAIAKDRVPFVVSLARGSQRRYVEVDLQYGLSLKGTVRSEEGNLLQGVDIRVVPGNAVAQEVLAREGIEISLNDAKTELSLSDGRRVRIPPFVRPKWETNRRGAFLIGGLETGRHLLEASAEGYVSERLRGVGVRADVGKAIEVVLFRGFSVVGRVVDGNGAPVADAEVRGDWLQPKAEPSRDRGELVHRVIRRRAAVRTAGDGSFRLGPFEAGPKIEVVAISGESGSSRRSEVFAPYDGLTLELRRDVVRGRVVDAATGEPIDSFELRAHRNGRTHSTRHADGHFEVNVDPDTDSIDIEAPGRFPWFTRLVTSGDVQDLGEIALERARSITGRVRYVRSGEPTTGALVRRAWQHYENAFLRVYTANSFGSRGAETLADGTFVLGDLPKSADRLEVRVRDRPVRFVDLPRDVTHLEIELAYDSVIVGFLVLPDGTPAKGIVRLWASGGYRSEREVGEDGAFRWGDLEGGEYRLTGESKAGVVVSRTVAVGNGESAEDIRLVVDPGGRVSGLITGLLRTEQVTVTLWDRDGRMVLRRDFGNGVYSVQGVPETTTLTARTNERRTPLAGTLVSGTPIADRVLVRMVRLDELGEAQLALDFSGSSRLMGTVRVGGRPTEGIDLAVVPKDELRPTAYATTGEQGRYAVQGISEGLHSVRTRSGHSFQVYVAHDATLDIELPGVSVSGTVRDGRTGQTVPGGWARLERVDAPAGSRTVAVASRIDGDGRFRFEGLARGDYVVHISHRDFADVSRRVHVTGSETVGFHLAPADAE